MVFSTYEFIFIFLPIVFIAYYSLGKIKSTVPQHVLLVLASLFFYGYFNPSYLAIIISSIIVNFILAKLMDKRRNLAKLFFSIGILFNIGMIAYYKYADFLIENINSIASADFPLLRILLPLGISFFTFQQFSFLLSVYKKEEKVESFINYCLFVTFFPQLVAGPIVLYSEMIPQFKDENRRKLNPDNITAGIFIFTLGLFKKIVLADTLAIFVDNGFKNVGNLGLMPAWAATMAYTFQIYFDFSGYCDMAIGLGKFFNIDLPLNFNSPYKSKSITEFWKRWHMTLGRALANYVYIPLGGNRKGKVRTYFNLFITFLVSGIWHGASWSFILWGVLHGIISIAERIFDNTLKKIPAWIRTAGTFLTVNFLWVLFRASNMGQAFKVYKGMFNFHNIGIDQFGQIFEDGMINFPGSVDALLVLFLLGVSFILVFACRNAVEKSKTLQVTNKTAISFGILFLISVIHMSRISPFIYFNF